GEDIAKIIQSLAAAGVENRVIVVNDGGEAVQYLKGIGMFAARKSYPLPELILLDLNMPNGGGFEVLRLVRSQEEFKTIPIVALTASDHVQDVNQAYKLGANSFMLTPDDFRNPSSVQAMVQHCWAAEPSPAPVVARPRG